MMIKLCYKNNYKQTDEYYFDLKSQKYIKFVYLHIIQSKIIRSTITFNLGWNIGNIFRTDITAYTSPWKNSNFIDDFINWSSNVYL